VGSFYCSRFHASHFFVAAIPVNSRPLGESWTVVDGFDQRHCWDLFAKADRCSHFHRG
jgi:hypothetical protein